MLFQYVKQLNRVAELHVNVSAVQYNHNEVDKQIS